MKQFFDSWDEIHTFVEELSLVQCVRCKRMGAFGKHGYTYTEYSPVRKVVRSRRVRCLPDKGGCGYAPTLRPADQLFNRNYTTLLVWSFLNNILLGMSVKAA